MSGSAVRLPNGDDFWVTMDIPNGEAAGILVLVITSVVSASAVVLLLGAIAISAWNTRRSSKINLFVRSHAAGYLISLLICDLFQATGSLMNARWYMDRAVVFESFCVTQGVIKQVADVGTAIWASVIACHTFWVLFLRWPLRRPVMIATMVFAWSTIAAVVITGPATLDVKRNGPFFAISGYWCWISPEYPVARVTLDYLFMFVAGFLTSALYLLVFLRLRGNILFEDSRLRFRARRKSDVVCGLSADDHTIRIARQMLLYPAAYIALLVPIAVCRFAEWSGNDIPFAATIFSDTVFLLSGIVNVLMFVFTRRVLPRHSIITKRFGKQTESRPTEVSDSTSPAASLDSFVIGNEDRRMEDDEEFDDDKVFMRVDSPDDGSDTMIPVHMVPSLPFSPPGASPSSAMQGAFPQSVSPGPRTSVFPPSATALMTYPQSPLPTQSNWSPRSS